MDLPTPAAAAAVPPGGHLPPDVTALLAAVRDALDIPPGDTAEDDRVQAQLLNVRASDARIILTAVLRGDSVADCTEQLRGWTAARPVTYTPWRAQREGGEPQ